MPVLVRPLYQDAFSPFLISSPPLEVTNEQRAYIREICSIGASDEQFAQKMYDAIMHILTGGSVKVPTVTLLSPATAVIGAIDFDVHVHGTNFTPESKIIFNGFEEPTTFFSETDIYTGVNMSVWAAAAIVPVAVQSKEGIISNSMPFEFTDVALMSAQSSKSGQLKESLKPVVTLPHTSVPTKVK